MLAQLGNPEPNDIILELSDESYYLDATREWTFSQQAQPLGALRDVSYQLFCGDEILESVFEQRLDKLCVARQLAELMRLPVQEVLSDFDAITNGSKWQEQGITPREIRSFCVWRQAPMFYVDCQGRLLDKLEPAIKEQRAVAFTSWNGHAFFYKSARTVARCEPIGDRAQAKYRGERKAGETPEFSDWREWEGEVGSGHFYTEDLEQVRRELLAEGHCPKVVMRSMSEWRCLRLRVRGGEDCVICAFHEDVEVLQAWMGRLGLPYRGQRLAGAASEVFLHLLKARRDPPGSRQAVLAEQDHQRKLCAAPITAATCELDHIVPVHQSFSAQAQNLQALCLECHPWSSRTPRRWSPASAGGLTRPTWNRPGCPRWSSSSTATSRSGSATESMWSGAARTPTHLLPQGQHGASPRGAPGGPDLREAPGGRAPGDLPAPPLRGRGLVRQARGGLHA